METAGPSNPGPGHLGYPMVMASTAGIELLGTLIGPTAFDPNAGRTSFRRYWEEHLYPSQPRRGVGDAVYQLVRHGLAHNFATKVAFGVTKENANHLTTTGGITIIDAITLFHDLRDSYRTRILPVAQGTTTSTGFTAASMQQRLDELGNDNTAKYGHHGAPLATLPAAAVTAVAPSATLPSGSLALPVTVSGVSTSFKP